MAHPGLEFDQQRTHNLQTEPNSRSGLEALPAEYQESAPQVQQGSEKELAENQALNPEKETAGYQSSVPVQEGRRFNEADADAIKSPTASKWTRWRKLGLLALIVVIIIIVIAIAVPLGLKRKNDHSTTGTSGSATSSTPSSPSPSGSSGLNLTGAFNGTGLATLNPNPNTFSSTHLFYQDAASQIRRVQKLGSKWSGGPDIPAIVGAGEARNATPLACKNYTDPNTNITTVSEPSHQFHPRILIVLKI